MQTMKISLKESTAVRPAAPRPQPTSLWISNLDMIVTMNYHTHVAHFFPFDGTPNFFDSTVLKTSLRRTLDLFYPAAGRLRWSGKRIEINCNDEGVLFVDAEADGRMDELGDFSPRPDLSLVPEVDYSKGIETYPLFIVQVTRFKCGGVCLGTGTEHHVFDGVSAGHFLKTWSNIVRGLDVTVPPFLDRSILSARNPPHPQFRHFEYEFRVPQHEDASASNTLIFKRLKLTADQLNALKAKCNDNCGADATYYSTFEVVAGHTWRCLTKVRQLPEDQISNMFISMNGRPRFRPPLPPEYFGNALLHPNPKATVDELRTKPLKSCVEKIHDAIAKIDDNYAISVLDYLELQPDLISIATGSHKSKSPNVVMVSWSKLGLYENMNFGWGQPVYVGPATIQFEGKIYVMASPVNDESLWIAITLPEDQMKLFEQVFYGDDARIT